MIKYRTTNNILVSGDLEIEDDLVVEDTLTCLNLTAVTGVITNLNIANYSVTDLIVTNDLTLIALTPGSIPYIGSSAVVTEDINNLYYDSTTSSMGIGTNTPSAKLHIVNTGSGNSFRVDDAASDTTVFKIGADGKIVIGATSSTTYASAALAIDSTTGGVLYPRYTQTNKLAISSPETGLQVFDTTTNALSYYNGATWFIPSWINFTNTIDVALPITGMAWDFFSKGNDDRITFSGSTITIVEPGIYEVVGSFTFRNPTGANEATVEAKFVQITGTVIVSKTRDQVVFADAISSTGNASMAAIFVVSTANDTYRFDMSSTSGGDAFLDGDYTNVYIRRLA